MRRTPGKARDFASHVPGGQCVGYENLDEFLHHPGLEAVYVSTRPGTHLEICKLVAQAGKACYVEKPVGRCAQETKEIKAMFDQTGLKLYTAYISRAYERTQVVRKLLEEGVIGSCIQRVSYKLVGSGGARDMDGDLPWRLDASQSGGGLIMDVGCHVLDRIDYVCGPLINVKGHAENRHSPKIPVEDFIHLTAEIGPSSWSALAVDDNATVECTWNFSTQVEEPMDELKIVGPKGSLQMAGMSPTGPIQVFDEKGDLKQEFEFEMPQHTARRLIQEVTNDLRNVDEDKREMNSNVLSFGENSIRTQEVIDTALSSYYGGRESGFWERQEWPGRPKESFK
jgi:predicted dehydrogenase